MKISRRQLREMILEQFRTKEDAAAHSLRTGHAMIWEPGMEDEPPVASPREKPGYPHSKRSMISAISGLHQQLSRRGVGNDVIRAAVMDALDEVLGGTKQ